jgi:ligand-binding SRPBCC domain-containing protein
MRASPRRLEREQLVPRPWAEVFPFFADAANLETLTPAFLRFRILTPLPIEMRAGARIEYRIRICGVPRRWRTLIERWDPPRGFVDVQEEGPYALWRHTHTFEEAPGGTLIRDAIEYEVPFGPLGAAAHLLAVRPLLERIFDFRRSRIEELFGRAPDAVS